MDAQLFDSLTRILADRRRLALSALLTTLGVIAPAEGKKRHKKHRRKKNKQKQKQINCSPGERPCQGHCIADDACCTNADCRALGECGGCYQGACYLDGRVCRDIYGPCYTCDAETQTCKSLPDRTECGPCRFCRGGNCLGCRALGECASCQGDACLPDGRVCAALYGPCWSCSAESFTCVQDGEILCDQGSVSICCLASEPCCNGVCCTGVCCGGSENGQCYSEPGYVCCGDTARSGCPSFDRCCGDECVDFDTYPEHCGSCFNACRPDQDCIDGNCECRQPGTKNCEGAKRCILEEQHCCGSAVCSSTQHCCDAGCCS